MSGSHASALGGRAVHTTHAVIECGVIAVLRLGSSDLLVPIAHALAKGGITAIEFSLTTPGALAALRDTVNELGKEVSLGAGTVMNVDAADRAIAAGAQFIVSPITARPVIDVCHASDVAVFPGALTPMEIQSAWEMGADLVKVFPADLLGPRYVTSLLAPLPHLKLLPTGGVNTANAGSYIAAGAAAVATSSLAAGPVPEISARARAFKAAIDEARAAAVTAV